MEGTDWELVGRKGSLVVQSDSLDIQMLDRLDILDMNLTSISNF